MRVAAWALACAVILWPMAAGAQQINGLAAWTIGSGSNTYESESYQNTAFSQHYILGLDSPIVDGRFMRVNTEGSFRTNALTSGSRGAGLKGDQRGIGYKLGAAMFPLRAFPLTVQATRDIVDESGQYPSTSAIRGGLVVPAGEAQPAFQTVNQSLNANWQLNTARLPHVELSYVKGNVNTAGSVYHAAQHHDDLHAGLLKETPRTRHAFHYDNSAIENLVSSAYNQSNNDLDYEFGAILSTRSRLNVHTGRRQSYSLFDRPSSIVDSGTGAYTVPSNGAIASRYVITSVSFEPSSRFSVDATGSLDRQAAAPAATGARLLTTSSRLDVGGGLTLNAMGTYGDREQIIGDQAVTVVTRSGQAGSMFRTGPHWLEGLIAFNRGVGANRTPEGISGETQMWSGQGTVTSSISWFSVSVGEERSSAHDQILDFGNADVLRDRASIQFQPGRLSFSANWEDATIDRGRDATFVRLWQRTSTGSASVRVTRGSTLTASAGEFTNIGISGTDMTQFWGGALEAQPTRALHFALSVREEKATSTIAGLDQQGLAWFGLAEYQLRQFTVAFEYRNTDQDLRSAALANRYLFKGRQLQMRISRKLTIPV